MFKKLLIANRGEIACRILRTLKRLDVRSVAVYSEADRFARHVLDADEAVCIGPAAAKDSYLNASAVLDAAHATHADAIHPGYGFLSEDADFAAAVERMGLSYVGPTAAQIRAFGLKHEARAIATQNGIPLLPGSDLIATHEAARAAVEAIGLPVMLKSTAGGGGIGMQICRDLCHLPDQLASVQALAQRNFGNAELFIERYVEHARHVEVQLFGDGMGNVVTLGTRDCSAQRRHQKVIEETPAPGLSSELLSNLLEAAKRLGRATRYRSAGTVEFLVDALANRFYFLEVNTRLQVEHGVTELVYGIDLVEWMLRVAAGDGFSLDVPTPSGCAIQARLYAEDPARQFRPNAGLLTEVHFPVSARVDTAVERGSEITAYYDPLLAKLLVHAATRAEALERLTEALRAVRLFGIETNLDYLIAITTGDAMQRGAMDTSMLNRMAFEGHSIEVVEPGTMTTVQDYPGRLGYWDVGIPPSGPMDDLNFRLANRIVGNLPGVPALEFTASGPTLCFALDGVVAITGADFDATLDGERVARYEPILVRRGQVLKLSGVTGDGWRGYLAVRHGFDVPSYLDSCATFTLGGFGGHAGRALRAGDILHVACAGGVSSTPSAMPAAEWPELTDHWHLGVIAGPHAAPDF
ncbi:MAG TPA: biotin carboxylase N-terminal domain-containing protein, partial [Polyangiaceae bacterium]